jgi:seryl-tRNA synthetase
MESDYIIREESDLIKDIYKPETTSELIVNNLSKSFETLNRLLEQIERSETAKDELKNLLSELVRISNNVEKTSTNMNNIDQILNAIKTLTESVSIINKNHEEILTALIKVKEEQIVTKDELEGIKSDTFLEEKKEKETPTFLVKNYQSIIITLIFIISIINLT